MHVGWLTSNLLTLLENQCTDIRARHAELPGVGWFVCDRSRDPDSMAISLDTGECSRWNDLRIRSFRHGCGAVNRSAGDLTGMA